MSYRKFTILLSTLLVAWFEVAARAAVNFDAPGAFNPIVPGYFADPTIKKFGDTYYIYATTDGNGGGRGPSQVWMSRDFVNWTLAPMNWPLSKSEHYWAPDVVKRDGRYYLYFSRPVVLYGAVSDTPIGPWSPLGGGDGLVVPNHLVKDVITLDGQVFADKRGDLFMYWGTWGIYANSGSAVGKLNPDMKSFSSLGKIPNTQIKDFFEAPFMLERDGLYYFMYSSGSCHDSTYRVQYAVGNSPDGEFKMGPNNPILATTADGTVDGPGHHSMLQEGDAYYMIYHRHDLPFTPNGMTRQLCADRMEFEGRGAIKAIVPTHQGIGYLAKHSEPNPNLAFGKKVTADSFYRDTVRRHDYKPEYAVDDNNATLWRPADNKMGHWLTVDLGSKQTIRRVLTQFEYATWYYQYLLESSDDGKQWKIFADRRENIRWGSPMVDRGDVEARYLRITVTGVEMPGLSGSVWNLKVYNEDRKDDLEHIADKAFADYIAPVQAQEGAKPSRQMPQTNPKPIIFLDAASLSIGASIQSWTNSGSLGGMFETSGSAPTVNLAGGCKGVRFGGKEILTASFRAPESLSGNSSFTVAVWVNNPEIAESECLISWAGRGGPDAATAQFNYGTHPQFGAVGHWGFADMGFNGKVPPAGQWHHLAVVFDGVIERVYVNGTQVNAAAKMLLMHRGQRIHIGASTPNTEFYDGYMASLRVYDTALSADEVGKLAADTPVADVTAHLDSARQEYGALPQWTNEGTRGGVFQAGAKAPVVEDVGGRIAVRFQPGQTLESGANPIEAPDKFSLVATIQSASAGRHVPMTVVGLDGQTIPVAVNLPDARWHQVIILRDGVYLDGQRQTETALALPAQVKSLKLGNDTFAGSLSRVQVFRRHFTATEINEIFEAWQGEWIVPASSFITPPQALSPEIITMSAKLPGRDSVGVQYSFVEKTGHAGGRSSGWISQSSYLNDGLRPDTQYAYQLKVRDVHGNVFTLPEVMTASTGLNQFNTFTPDFTVARDFLAQDVAGTGWSGLVKDGQGGVLETVAATNGVLHLQSRNTVWDGGAARGPFLYETVSGDFVVQVKVADYSGLATRRAVGSDDGGLMARLPTTGRQENLVALSFFPPWNQGNMFTSTINGGRRQKGNMLGFNAKRHLQIIRIGSQVHFRISDNGQDWTELPESPVDRPDLAGKTMQVGLFHASYGEQSNFISFSDFRLTTKK
jgi:hypothetical protein